MKETCKSEPIYRYRQSGPMTALFWLAVFVVVATGVYQLVKPDDGYWSLPNQIIEGAVSLGSGAIAVVILSQFIDWDSIDKEPRPGLEIWDDRIVIDPELNKVEIPLSRVSRIEYRNSEDGPRFWLILRDESKIRLTAQLTPSMKQAFAQAMLPLKRLS